MIPLISTMRFSWEKYLSQQHYNIFDLINPKLNKLEPGVTPIGYCNARHLEVRPRTDQLALLVEVDGNEVWFHILDLPETNERTKSTAEQA